VDISPNGEVTIEFPGPTGQYGQETLSLDGITFRAAN
jgi:hypothetical protein